ncbi:serine/arginine repetitive matrix protein 2-like [Penaeus monodon]|uniref:serine/arginine repetitive matrix protein 2-like n=1 Tax=Penaeus monodon TaxID=6687 RepID=UPI0018A7A3CB|nr:serine/arginine repetitive matrix protein 2-like [Penaeus monodon]
MESVMSGRKGDCPLVAAAQKVRGNTSAGQLLIPAAGAFPRDSPRALAAPLRLGITRGVAPNKPARHWPPPTRIPSLQARLGTVNTDRQSTEAATGPAHGRQRNQPRPTPDPFRRPPPETTQRVPPRGIRPPLPTPPLTHPATNSFPPFPGVIGASLWYLGAPPRHEGLQLAPLCETCAQNYEKHCASPLTLFPTTPSLAPPSPHQKNPHTSTQQQLRGQKGRTPRKDRKWTTRFCKPHHTGHGEGKRVPGGRREGHRWQDGGAQRSRRARRHDGARPTRRERDKALRDVVEAPCETLSSRPTPGGRPLRAPERTYAGNVVGERSSPVPTNARPGSQARGGVTQCGTRQASTQHRKDGGPERRHGGRAPRQARGRDLSQAGNRVRKSPMGHRQPECPDPRSPAAPGRRVWTLGAEREEQGTPRDGTDGCAGPPAPLIPPQAASAMAQSGGRRGRRWDRGPQELTPPHVRGCARLSRRRPSGRATTGPRSRSGERTPRQRARTAEKRRRRDPSGYLFQTPHRPACLRRNAKKTSCGHAAPYLGVHALYKLDGARDTLNSFLTPRRLSTPTGTTERTSEVTERRESRAASPPTPVTPPGKPKNSVGPPRAARPRVRVDKPIGSAEVRGRARECQSVEWAATRAGRGGFARRTDPGVGWGPGAGATPVSPPHAPMRLARGCRGPKWRERRAVPRYVTLAAAQPPSSS